MISLLAGLNRRLEGTPDRKLTVALTSVAALLLWVAYFAPPAWKAALLVWVVLP
jgi:hypothetical protein